MNKSVSHFKLILIFAFTLSLSIGGYIAWVLIDYHTTQVQEESVFLAKFASRAISRYNAAPKQYAALSGQEQLKIFGSERANMALNYQTLKDRFPFIPPEDQFSDNTFKAVMINSRGYLKVPNFLLILPTYLPTGKHLYSYVHVNEHYSRNQLDVHVLERIQPAIFIALISIFLVIVVELIHIKRVNSSINEFAHWANQLNTGVISSPIPKFSSAKHSYMAFTIDKSLSGISQMLEKEQSFAKLTSHELRTPIAVLSANLELLELMVKDLSPQERHILKNMESAISDMKYQMEALLWLSSESEAEFDYVPCDTRPLLEKALQDNSYLILTKDLSIHVEGDGDTVIAPPIFLQIIINNLIRNAYQNTDAGTIRVELGTKKIIIENRNGQISLSSKRHSGFGIGLALVDKLVQKMGINYHVVILENGRRVTLEFSINPSPQMD